MPLDDSGKPRTDLTFGEADKFLDFIEQDVVTNVQETLFPQAPLRTGRKALFGHSYGGIFALNAFFTRPTLFDTFIAASPTIWWNKYALVRDQEAAFRARETPADPAPSLLLTWGSGAQDLDQRPRESDEEFKKRKDCAEDIKMRDSAKDMVARLKDCPSVRRTWTWEFEGEDHGSAAVTGLQQGLQKFLAEKM